MGFSARRVPWKGPLQGVSALEGLFQQRFQQGFQQVLYHPFHLHSVLFQATVDVSPQLVQGDESVAEPQARGDNVASVVDSVSVAWQARRVVTWPTSAAVKRGPLQSSSVPVWPNAVVQGSRAQCGDNERHEGGVHVSGPSEWSARQEATRVHVWRWKRAAPILVVSDVP